MSASTDNTGCVFRGVKMTHPFTLFCSDAGKGMRNVGRSIDGAFLITSYAKDFETGIGYWTIECVPGLDLFLHPPSSDFP